MPSKLLVVEEAEEIRLRVRKKLRDLQGRPGLTRKQRRALDAMIQLTSQEG